MFVLAAMLGPRFPNWAFDFTPTPAEEEEAARVFGEPHDVVATAQLQIRRDAFGGGYVGKKMTWDGIEMGATLTELASKIHPWSRNATSVALASQGSTGK